MMIIDCFLLSFSGYFTLLVRFELSQTYFFKHYKSFFIELLPFFIIAMVIIFILFNLYNIMWSKASIREATIIFFACLSTIISQILISVFLGKIMPRSYYIMNLIFFYSCEMAFRFSYRAIRIIKKKFDVKNKNVMIVGAGDAGATLLNEIKNSLHSDSRVVCFIDDNEYKINKSLNGIKIVGNRYDIPKMCNKYNVDEIYIAMPTANGKDKSEIIDIANKTNCKIKIVPGIYQLVNGEVSISALRDVNIEDLLGRKPIKINTDEILSYVENKTVLVTGAGGSIGSEICRQIAKHNPKTLVMIDIYENNIYEVQLELKHKYQKLDLITLICSVRDYQTIDELFDRFKPDIVFHAAAHKHVPLMEDAPKEAIKNNCQGTLNVVKASDKYSVKKFILISTDKAVNPTSVMGTTKKICEMIIQYFSKYSKTNFVAVRFGNVLGSNGSVVPLFKKQIEMGGPVTVTDKNIIRYFMTIPEAVALVLQAGAYAKGSEIFVLDMGEPVKIYDMAKNLIKLSGYEPEVDIKIEFVGLRPGEKLYEELLTNEEGMKKTNNDRILIANPIDIDYDNFLKYLNELIEESKTTEDNLSIKQKLKQLVPSYTGVDNV